jgi:hypothetical protein
MPVNPNGAWEGQKKPQKPAETLRITPDLEDMCSNPIAAGPLSNLKEV